MTVWDNFNKQYLEVMNIHFNNEGNITLINGYPQYQDPLEGFYTFKGDDLKHIAISTNLYFNVELFKNFYCQRDIEGEIYCDDQCEHCKEYYKPLT